MKAVPFRRFDAAEHETWRQLFARQAVGRSEQIVDLFSRGLEACGITGEGVPELSQVNKKLESLTGFKGVPVEGLEGSESFYPMLARREFPIGNFIRDPKDLSYTPAPDVFHDLYGHLPFFADAAYANFCADLGLRASRYLDSPTKIRQFERLFWFAVEFALLETPVGRRIFGAGIASSFGECRYALSNEPELIPFDLHVIRAQEFKIDEFQKRLFVIKDVGQLYGCLDSFEAGL